MASFKSPTDVLNDMIADYQALTGETLDPSDNSREEIIKMKTYAGAISGMYSALQRVEDDVFPESASEQGLEMHLQAKQLPPRIQPTASNGVILHTGTPGTVIPANTQVKHNLTGRIYVSTASATLDGTGNAQVSYESLVAGQASNIAASGEAFTMVNTITGATAAVSSVTPFSDGRDLETPAEMLARIEAANRFDDTGGNLPAYERLAQAASPLVVSAKAIKNPRGFGTVNTVITSGTTDIEGAVDAGQAVTRIPSTDLINTVQASVIAKNPTTDDHLTVAPTETTFDVTVTYALYDETLRTSVNDAITKVVKVFIYTAAPGDILNPAQLERAIDLKVGHLISYRRVNNFGGASPLYTVPSSQLIAPGTITLLGLS